MAHLHAYVTDQVRTDDPARTASTLLALAGGLATHLLCGFLAPDAAGSALDAALDEAFGPT